MKDYKPPFIIQHGFISAFIGEKFKKYDNKMKKRIF